jgi:outer membrane protein TolC
MDRTDAHLARLADQKAGELGIPPARTSRVVEALPGEAVALDQQSRAVEKVPGTRNPASSELAFSAADEARDVAARLERYADRSSADTATPPASLAEILRRAQEGAPEYLAAEEDYILAGIRLLIQRHLWSPRLFNDTSLALDTQGDEGRFETAARLVNNLRVTKRLPFGGEAEARWVWRATEQLRQQTTGRYRQSSELVVSGRIPILQGAGRVAQEDLIQAERDLVYQSRDFEDFRRGLLVQIAGDFFDLLQAKAQIDNQERQLQSLLEFEQAETARYEAGRIAEFRRNQASNNVLTARATLASLREQYILQLDRFKVRLGMKPEHPLVIGTIDLQLAEPEITPEDAAVLALDYRLDLQNRRDRVDDAARALANARNRLLPALDATGEVALPTDPSAREGGLSPDVDSTRASAGLTLSLPLDREQERLQLRGATIALGRARRDLERARDDAAVRAKQTVRSIDLARFQLRLAEQRVEINKRRLDEIQLKADSVDTKTRLDANNELTDSENARDRAKTALRNAVLDYLLQTGQLRVRSDGTLIEPGTASPPGTPEGARP